MYLQIGLCDISIDIGEGRGVGELSSADLKHTWFTLLDGMPQSHN